jgi:hypothetical protein
MNRAAHDTDAEEPTEIMTRDEIDRITRQERAAKLDSERKVRSARAATSGLGMLLAGFPSWRK